MDVDHKLEQEIEDARTSVVAVRNEARRVMRRYDENGWCARDDVAVVADLVECMERFVELLERRLRLMVDAERDRRDAARELYDDVVAELADTSETLYEMQCAAL